jgi:hypothetical protein
MHMTNVKNFFPILNVQLFLFINPKYFIVNRIIVFYLASHFSKFNLAAGLCKQLSMSMTLPADIFLIEFILSVC